MTDHPTEFPAWRFQYLDTSFPNATGWQRLTSEDFGKIVETIRHIERLHMSDVFQGRGATKGGVTRYDERSLESGLAADARNRLAELELETDHLVRVRVQWEKRLYAFQGEGNMFNLLWWDPNHEVYPGEPK